MAFEPRFLKILQKRMNYSDDQLEMFVSNPRNEEVLGKARELNETVLVLTVVESHGCNSMHKAGDRIFLDGAGNLLTRYCSAKICTYALHNAVLMVFAANEFIYSGLSPESIKFKRCSCFDVGAACGGLGRIILELSVTDLKSLQSEFAEKEA